MTAPARRGLTIVGGFRSAGPVVRLLVLTQLAFNVGFFMVLPYLAVHLSSDLGATVAVVGAVLGLRTFAQQGLFVVGGALADRLGTRPVILAGIACRIVGFLTLGLSAHLFGVAVGALLTGFAGALFSPAVEAALARAAVGPEAGGDGAVEGDAAGGRRLDRLDAFALLSSYGQLGTFVGPLVGAALLAADFAVVCCTAAGLFAVIGAAHLRWLPADGAGGADGSRPGSAWRDVARDRAFLLFAALVGTQLVAYNQLYLLLPRAVDRAWGSQAPVGVLFAVASVLVVAGQLPLSARLGGYRPRRVIAGGLGVMALSFAVGGLGVGADLTGVSAIVALAAFVGMFTIGQMAVMPSARAMIPAFAGERSLGTYYGAFASIGGAAVLPAAVLTGLLIDHAPPTGAGAAAPWWAMAALLAVAAVAIRDARETICQNAL